MSRKNGDQAPSVTTPHPIFGFYQPHKPVRFNNEIVNPVTGEISYPPSMTKQEFVRQCDINNIIKEFTLTGQVNHIAAKAAQGVFMDLPDSVDYQDHLNAMIRAQEAFQALPAAIRNRFHGNPAEFLAFCEDPANGDELIKLGLRQPPPRATAAGEAGGANPEPAPGPAPGGSNPAS